MGLLPDTQSCELRMRLECFPRHPGLAMPTCITARASHTCRDACRDGLLAVSFEVGGGGNVPGKPGACATRNFGYLVRGPLVRRHKCIYICVANRSDQVEESWVGSTWF